MSELSPEFDEYVEELTKRNRVALRLLVGATLTAVVLLAVFFGMQYLDFRFEELEQLQRAELPPVVALALQNDAMNALSLANISANLAVAAAVRIWYTRQDKMTTLLTHAMVLEGENETAIRVLLNKKMRR